LPEAWDRFSRFSGLRRIGGVERELELIGATGGHVGGERRRVGLAVDCRDVGPLG
jgi:hypothetical protein